MGWKDIPPPKTKLPGEWEAFSYGAEYRGWLLRCGSSFHVHITGSSGKYYTTINSDTLPVAEKLDVALQEAEREIVRRVRDMLPAYKSIYGRAIAKG